MIVDLAYEPPACVALYYEQVDVSQVSQTYNQAFEHIVHVEGEKFDVTGPSRYGVTLPELARYLRVRHVSVERLRRLTKAEAKELYYHLYWRALRIDQIQSESIAIAVLDQTVHRGTFGGVSFLQKVINEFASEQAVIVNGLMTPETLTILNEINEHEFVPVFISAIQQSYRRIALKNPRKRKFLEGWLERSKSLHRRISR